LQHKEGGAVQSDSRQQVADGSQQPATSSQQPATSSQQKITSAPTRCVECKSRAISRLRLSSLVIWLFGSGRYDARASYLPLPPLSCLLPAVCSLLSAGAIWSLSKLSAVPLMRAWSLYPPFPVSFFRDSLGYRKEWLSNASVVFVFVVR
jgi:hypothetical protein